MLEDIHCNNVDLEMIYRYSWRLFWEEWLDDDCVECKSWKSNQIPIGRCNYPMG
jgi:hypothetical protein